MWSLNSPTLKQIQGEQFRKIGLNSFELQSQIVTRRITLVIIIMRIAHIHCGLSVCWYVSLSPLRRICFGVTRCACMYWGKTYELWGGRKSRLGEASNATQMPLSLQWGSVQINPL